MAMTWLKNRGDGADSALRKPSGTEEREHR
jgi:hypothetical protein